MSPSRVSVVLPVFNGAAYLGEALRSVVTQTFESWELIVVDDGSTDNSRSVVEDLGSDRVRYERQTHSGTAAARNRGVELAASPLIAHLDADDLWEPQKLALQVEALDRNPDWPGVGAHLSEFYSPDCPQPVRDTLRPARREVPGLLLQALLVRRETHQRVGPFETRWKAGQDMSWLLRAGEAGIHFPVLPQVLVRRRLHAGNKGVVRRDLMSQRLHILKASLERRRAADDDDTQTGGERGRT